MQEYAPDDHCRNHACPRGGQSERNAGFQPLADYIFAKDRNGGEIAMPAPVTQATRQKIAMTAPVTQESPLAGSSIAFTMPADI
ncbi:MAG: heme-binding protein [Hyphomonadaceae bacterium]|nr:heme-binding protein [Hyphomonadaceae bacterium]